MRRSGQRPAADHPEASRVSQVLGYVLLGSAFCLFMAPTACPDRISDHQQEVTLQPAARPAAPKPAAKAADPKAEPKKAQEPKGTK